MIAERCDNLNLAAIERNEESYAFRTFFIWFDGKGYKVQSVEELIKYSRQATSIDQITFTIETIQSKKTNRQDGTWMELRVDEKNINNCSLTVASDNKDWVDASWVAAIDLLHKCKNRYRCFRTPWTLLSIQLLGVMAGFLLSLWAASKLSPKLSIDSAFAFSFICIFIIFSNLWTFVIPLIIKGRDYVFPNVKFIINGKAYFHWIVQAIIGGVVSAIVLSILGYMLVYALEVFNGFVKK